MSDNNRMDSILIVGGGAAGMLAGIAAASGGKAVHIFEKNEKLGKKVYITGKGRCNVTNACDTQELLEHIVTNPRFLYSSFYGFSNFDMMELLEKLGCPLKTERGGRVFPVSDKSSDVIKALSGRLHQLGVTVHLHTSVTELLIEEGRCRGLTVRERDGKEKQYLGKVIVAAGGLSYPATGSTGDGYDMARKAGHKVTELFPALVPFETEGDTAGRLQGLALKNVEVTVKNGKKEIYRDFGEMLFTGHGMSGPMILCASAHLAHTGDFACTVQIVLKPALDMETLDKRVLRDFSEAPNRNFSNVLQKLLPQKLVPVITDLSGISGEQKVNSITRVQRDALCRLVKGLQIPVSGPGGFDEAVVTAGGIAVAEIDPKSMRSKLVSNLYFAGEMIDVDAYTGGYNLQIAWSTGYKAGMSAALNEGE